MLCWIVKKKKNCGEKSHVMLDKDYTIYGCVCDQLDVCNIASKQTLCLKTVVKGITRRYKKPNLFDSTVHNLSIIDPVPVA